MAIPKILHRIRIGADTLPAEAEEYGRRWRELHPGWEHRLWTARDLPKMRNRALYDVSENTGHRSDLLRYEILHRFGGVYVDLDMEPLRPLDPVLAEAGPADAFAGRVYATMRELGPQWMETAILGAAPGLPFFDHLLDRITPWAVHFSQAHTIVRTGPQFFQWHMTKWEAERGGEPVRLMPTNWFYPYRWDERYRRGGPFPGAYAAHHWWGTWLRQPDAMRIPGLGPSQTAERKKRRPENV
jgi:mannosyltransferase OCH1-like enzyme